MRIGIYGGSFNPPHIGHLHVADVARKAADLDYVIFVPAGNPYMKPKEDIAPAEDRFRMTQLAVFGETKYFVSNIEARRDKPSYTAETMKHMKTLYKNDELFLIVGQDAFEQMPSWYHPEETLETCRLLVVKRGDLMQIMPASFADKIEYILDPGVDLNISSTQIRNCLKNNIPVNRLIDDNVLKYIEERRLYR